MPTALVRRPGPLLADGLLTHLERVPVDVDAAAAQWQEYVAALDANGWDVVEVAAADDCPDAVFVEDAVVVFDDLAVLTRPGAPSRRAEVDGVHEAVSRLGLDIVTIAPPGRLDGGDVLKVVDADSKTAYVGLGGRTDTDGCEQLARLVASRGWSVRPVPVRSVLHLKSAVTALPDGTIIGHPDVVDEPSAFPRFLAMPEPEGGHVVLLGGDRLLISSAAPRSAEMLSAMGYETIVVDIDEFEKLEGCVTCLSVRVRI